MNKEQEAALEVAKLAAMVGGELKKIDQFTSERTANPANKININNFIAKVKNPNVRIKPASYLTNVPEGFAAPLPEEVIQAQVPDVRPVLNPDTAPFDTNVVPASVETTVIQHSLTPKPEAVSVNNHKNSNTQKDNLTSLLTRSDIDSIRNSLKNIDKTLLNMLNLFKNSKLNND